MKRKRTVLNYLWGLLTPCIIVAVLLCFASALENFESGRETEERKQLETVLRKGCVACYAVEGTYPPNLEYLKDQYGVQVNEAKYRVYYNIFAQNLMPDITVLESKP